MVRPVRTFNVTPLLPPALERLRDLAYNLRWTWDHATVTLFRRLDDEAWEASRHNPVAMLGLLDQARLEAAAGDEGFVAQLDRVAHELDAYLAHQSTWASRSHEGASRRSIAYFSAEFGITECLSIFAGGLGLLAGDHLKSASDLGLPLVGVGLLYQQGYFRQQINEAGWQRELYENNDFFTLPLTLETAPDGAPLVVAVDYPGRTVRAQVWRAQVGRVPLYLLDTNLPANAPADRDVTDQLYGGDLDTRIRQEILLGIGGYRALQALGHEPIVYHMNEGHSAFLALERIRDLMQRAGTSFAESREAASTGLVFTTHTPVAAGHDYFPPGMMEHYFTAYAGALGLSFPELLALGQQATGDRAHDFCMTVLALRLAGARNGVSRLHGQVSREMWQGLWPGVPEDEVPISHVTNGVHQQTWLTEEMEDLYERYLGPRWREEPAAQRLWERVRHVPDGELWRTHERRRERLIVFARRWLRWQLERGGAPRHALDAADEVLQRDTLTIGFARRFATYKRAGLLLHDPERLARLLNNPERPVQIIFAGKAHPRDDAGKAVLREIVLMAREERFRRRLIFLEDYDTAVARAMVQGCDVWLNNPLRPEEASGTSGMKAVVNGGLHVSTLDGWWDEAWRDNEGVPIGWAIGRGETYPDPAEQDALEAQALYELMEGEIVPTFYDRDEEGLPRRWTARMKASISALCWRFNTHRMVWEYDQRVYRPAVARYEELTADACARARALAAAKARFAAHWAEVAVESVDGHLAEQLHVGQPIGVRAIVRLGELVPAEVDVQLYSGRVDPRGELSNATLMRMRSRDSAGPGRYHYEAVEHEGYRGSGLHGYTVRVLPRHADLQGELLPGLITWAPASPSGQRG